MNLKNTILFEELLKDESFIIWSFCDDAEAPSYWSNYVKEHPEEKDTILEARKKLRSVRFNSYTLTDADKSFLKIRIDSSINKRKPRKYFISMLPYAAAVVIVACLFVGLSIRNQHHIEAYYAQAVEPKIEDSQEEIELVLSSQKKVELHNSSEIKVNNQGNVHVKSKLIASLSKDHNAQTVRENKKMNVLKVPKGRHSSIILPDGSKLWVNSGSIVQFPSEFDKKHRTIYVNGEAFLKVAHDSLKPFHVVTSKIDVHVLGTQFNVSAYEEEQNHSVVLKEGKVSVKTKTNIEKEIKPNEKFMFDGSNFNISRVDVNDYISWTEGYLQFTQRPLNEILTKISKYYRISIECPSKIQNIRCSGKLILFDNVDDVMKTLRNILNINYKIEREKIMINVEPEKINNSL